ncbi:MAG: transglycosylase SLT domain-containing protein [Burkholderiales bacterium]|nr:transglycosylase SLT domain-containing protein [Burkholderiales bacterium]MDE2395465.1 transglycosylase SLT domain-containing protein [Burkholderiales bacterium]MDE2452496.1 transglycosylase SLT domain-containing protein [Burkholderiales bacterium]
MATVIDALLVTLGMDVSGFKKGEKETQEALKKTRDETDRHTKEMAERAKVTAAAFNKVKTEILGMLGVALSGAGIARFVEKITTSDAAVGRMATNLGVATRDLSAWGNMAEKFGGDASDMEGAFRTAFNIAQSIKSLGSSAAYGPLGLLFGRAGMGNGLAQLNQLSRSNDIEGIIRLLQKAVVLSKDKSLALSLMQQAGFSEQTFNVMREVNTQLDHQLELQRQLNVANQRDADLAIQRQQAWSRLGDSIEVAGRKMLNAPTTTRILNDDAGAIRSMTEDPSSIAHWITSKSPSLTILSGVLSMLTGSIGRTMFSQGGATGSWGGSSPPTAGSGGGSKRQFLSNLESTWGLPAGTLDAMYAQESSRGKNLLSPKGAKGPFQFMPATAAQYGIAGKEFDFGASADAAAHYMHDLLVKYGNLRQALMAYNGGGGGAAGRFPESVNYANSIMARMSRGGGSTTDIKVGPVTINTAATDAKGIAKDFTSAVTDSYSFASQSTSGLR